MTVDEFEWDQAKAQRNLAKHGVSFEAALLVFEDAFALEYFDFVGRTTIRYKRDGQEPALDGRLYRARQPYSNHFSEKSHES